VPTKLAKATRFIEGGVVVDSVDALVLVLMLPGLFWVESKEFRSKFRN